MDRRTRRSRVVLGSWSRSTDGSSEAPSITACAAEGSTPEETVAPEQIEPVELVVDGQVRLGAAYVKATQQPPRAYVLYFHGICCNLNQHIARPKGLANLGYDVLVFDYRGWGTSSDLEPTEPGLLGSGNGFALDRKSVV